ncbi:MAG: alpha/beta hydrolase [Bdellovibrionales bacterium]|nr:alpha/beta hydrolase [Bdellovibrionales bacterium]
MIRLGLFFAFLSLILACSHKAVETKIPISPQKGFDAELSNYAYPFPVEYFKLNAQGQDLKMAYMDLKPAQAAQDTIVLLHGKNFTGAYFAQLANALVAKNFRVIIPDQIGFGKSTKPKSFQYSFQALATNTDALMESLGIHKYRVFGHSMGGMVATRLSLMHPEKVTRLYLVNPIGLEDWKTMTSYRTIDENYKSELASTPEKAKAYQQENYYGGSWRPEYDKWVEVPRGWMEGPDYPLIAWNSALTSDMIFTQPVVYEFKNLKQPTVLVVGQKDRTAIGRAWAPEGMKKKMGDYPKLGRQVAKMIPKATLIEIKNVGHLPFIEDFDGFWKVFEPNLK